MSAARINITLGTAGHIDHGKTALIKNLTGCETDRLKEEKERGMSIELGFAPCRLADLEVGIVDVPGHEHFIKTMVAGATGMDGVIFVVAADDGVMPQTREHLDILTLLGLRAGVVALTKIDRVDAELLEIVRQELSDFLKGTFLENAPILPVSNVNGDGFGDLHAALQDMVRSISPRRVDGVFRLPVERAFSVRGYGTVVSGIPVAGALAVGDEIELLPQRQVGRVKAMQVYGQDSARALSGQCAAINVRHWDHQTIVRGNVITTPGYFSPERWYVGRLRLLAHDRLVVKNGASVKFHTGTSETVGVLYLLQGERLNGGAESFVQVKLNEPIVAGPGDHFIIRGLSPVETIGGGVILEAVAKRIKRSRPGLVEELTEQAAALVGEKAHIEYCVKNAGPRLVEADVLALRAKIPRERLPTLLDELTREEKLIHTGGGWYLHSVSAARAAENLVPVIAEFHRRAPESPGPTAEQLVESTGLDPLVLATVLERLKVEKRLVERGQRFALPGYRETVSGQDRALLDTIEGCFRRGLFHPPDIEELPAKIGANVGDVRRGVAILLQQERLVQVADDLVFHREAIDRGRELLVSYFKENRRLESVRFKYLLDTSRKYAIPLLDFFDRIGVTRRVGHTRYLNG